MLATLMVGLVSSASATYELSVWGLPAGTAIVSASAVGDGQVEVSLWVRTPFKVTWAQSLVELRDGHVVSGVVSSDAGDGRRVTTYRVREGQSTLRRTSDSEPEAVAHELVDALTLLYLVSREADAPPLRTQWVWTGHRLSALTLERSDVAVTVRQSDVVRAVLELDASGGFPTTVVLDSHLLARRVRGLREAGATTPTPAP